jgi:hypothetical protein
MAISMVFLALFSAARRGAFPSSGSIINFILGSLLIGVASANLAAHGC